MKEYDRFAVEKKEGLVIRSIAEEEQRDLGVVIVNAMKKVYPEKFKNKA